MASFSQPLEFTKEGTTFKGTQRFSPFTHAASSAVRGRRHLRTRSENSVIRYNGALFGFSTRQLATDQDEHNKECSASSFEHDRKRLHVREDLATCSEGELSAHTMATVNAKKRLHHKHEFLDPELRRPSAGNEQGDFSGAREVLIKKLVAEADVQQEAIDIHVPIKRGRHCLHHNTSRTIDDDLEYFLSLKLYRHDLHCNKKPELIFQKVQNKVDREAGGQHQSLQTPSRERKLACTINTSSVGLEKDKALLGEDEYISPHSSSTDHESFSSEGQSPGTAESGDLISNKSVVVSTVCKSEPSEEYCRSETPHIGIVRDREHYLKFSKTPQQFGIHEEAAEFGERVEKSKDKPKSKKEGRNRIIAANLWPAENKNGWLRVPGEGVFTSVSCKWQRISCLLDGQKKCGDPSPSASGCSGGGDPKMLGKLMELTPERERPSAAAPTHLTMPGPQKPAIKQVESLLGKRSKEIEMEHLDCANAVSEVAAVSLQSGLTASEESLNRELDSIREASQSLLNVSDGELSFTFLDSSMGTGENEGSGEKICSNREEIGSPTGPKRRRLNMDTPSCSENSSWNGTPSSSPAGTLPRDFKQRYTKDALWKAIESNYQYLMDKEIIETCQLTENDLSNDEDFMPGVSMTEFLKQYQELTDWLNHVQRATQRTVTSLSEKYLNQTYHEEMLHWTPKREYLSKYAHQLALLYPSQRNQVYTRMQTLNNLWQVVEAVIVPQQGIMDMDCIVQDLESDLATLRRWLNATETRLLPMTIRADWTNNELEERLKHHQLLQQDIESHSRIVSAVLKLSERLENERTSCSCDADRESLQLVALNLQKRWHGIWLQSLEWQCRLEEAINRRKGLYGSSFNFSSFNLPSLDESFGGGSDLDLNAEASIHDSSNGSLIELSDDSLLFIGLRSDHHLGHSLDSSGVLSSSQGSNPSSPRTSAVIRFLDRSSGDSANISEAESRMGDSPSDVLCGRVNLSLSMSSDGETDPEKSPLEPKDIGYSSESQSNDETETMHQQIALECRYAGICEVASDSPLGEKIAIPPSNGICQDYYCMTLVDIDSTDKTTDDGNTTDDRTSPANLQPLKQGGEAAYVSENDAADVEDIVVKSWLESSDEADQALGEQVFIPVECNHCVGSMSESDSAAETQEKIKYLIDHAEDLVKASPPRSIGPGSPERHPSPSKQTQTICTSSSSVESSCDASGEDTSEESGTEEFSTATDDADETLFDSVINLDSTNDSRNSQEDMPTFVAARLAIDSAQLRRRTGPHGNRKERPWSVVEFEDFNKIDFRPLSTSESAIDSLRTHADVDANSVSPFMLPNYASTFPRRNMQGTQFRRAFSSSCDQSSTQAARRRLKYSSSSTADSQTTKLALSTEDEDDRTLLCDSTGDAMYQGCLPSSESESETSDEYETAPLDEMITSADEDPHNSTGSFSENAWDNYQPMYPTASEDATEEPLHWEPSDDLEFDDEFQLTNGSNFLLEAIKKRTAKEEKRVCIPGDCEDSDSDMDDFHCVLDDSEACLKAANHSLQKFRKNPMNTGLAEKPSLYLEILATCSTNISCLRNICEHLSSEDIGIGDVARVRDLLYEWEKLHALASERHQQAQLLSASSKAIVQMKELLSQACQATSFENFSTEEELQTCITDLRILQSKLDAQQHSIKDHQETLNSFAQHHPNIDVTIYTQEFASLEKSTFEINKKVSAHAFDLERNRAVWCEYLEEQKELHTMTTAARERLFNILCQREAGHRLTKRIVLKELETLQENLSEYEARLCLLQVMRKRLTRVSNDEAQHTILATLADLRNQLLVTTQRCREMYRDVEEDEELPVDDLELGCSAVPAAAFQESKSLSNSLDEFLKTDITTAAYTATGSRTGQSTSWSWLRSLPVRIVALMMLAGLVYVFDPDVLSSLGSFSITLTPELKYVNGPPPI